MKPSWRGVKGIDFPASRARLRQHYIRNRIVALNILPAISTCLATGMLGWAATAQPANNPDLTAAPLPEGTKAVWDLSKAQREKTSTRERICLNGLWQWQPAEPQAQQLPAGLWGWFKVPGAWPGITDYMQKDCQTVLAHPAWSGRKFGDLGAAWYQREFSVPEDWAGRRMVIAAEYVNSLATVYVDGRRAGEIRFPGGELDITVACRPGGRHRLSLLVVALPLKGVMLSYTDSASAREVKGAVARRGLCGDVYLVSTPPGPRVGDVTVATSVRQRQMTVGAALEELAATGEYTLRARVSKDGRTLKEFLSPPCSERNLEAGRFAFTEQWMPDHLWDLHRPQQVLTLELSLLDSTGRVLDSAWPVRFGFREFWIEGRDFYLNGDRLFLSVVPLDNAQVSAALSTYAAARESLERLQDFGINFVYAHNYDCLPGSHLSFAEILRAADDVGMLVALTQPHFSHYDWQASDADQVNGYRRHAEFYTRVAGSHPSVVMYSMNHNATGYSEDMNPDLIDGLHDPRDNWSARNARQAVRAEAIVRRLDPSRIVYHHASGNLGAMHQINFYPNFAPIQELSDWFEHWATAGVKPVFLCEYGAPFTWDWTMYRGWFNGKREFGSAAVPWEFCLAEWNAQFFGDRAFQVSEPEKANLRWEAKQLRAGKVWHRWDYPHQVGSTIFDERYPVFAAYLTDNWRAFRTWGVSAISPWEHGHFWKLRDGLNRNARQELPVDWERLQRPGFSPDYLEQRYERMDLAYERSDWIATPAAEALLRNNRPLLAYLAGKPARFTCKDHNFLPGETIEKQLIVINNSREPASCECDWTLDLPQPVRGSQGVRVGVGRQERVPLRIGLPKTLKPGRYQLAAVFKFSQGETQTDQLALTVLPSAVTAVSRSSGRESASSSQSASQSRRTSAATTDEVKTPAGRIALFDPKGETRALLSGLGIPCQAVGATADLSGFGLLIVGKAALTVNSAAPDIRRVREGLKVLMFEQTPEVLEKRFGFRVAEYGLRQVFPRIADHPALAGLTVEHLRDWRGEATILPPRLQYELNPKFNGAPTVTWCGLPVPRLWRCGNQGNVASVLIEKPARGDFLPILDGGYSLQYSPLMEYREGEGLVLFCQTDVTGRSESDPAAAALARNLLDHVSTWKPARRRTAVYLGEPAGKRHLESVGIAAASFDGGNLSLDQLLVAGPGAGPALAGRATVVADWLKAGGQLLAIGMDQSDAEALLPFKVSVQKSEHISTCFEPLAALSPLAGVSPAEVHNRDPRELPLVAAGVRVVGNGVLAHSEDGHVVFCQLVPWQFANPKQPNLRRTYRRSSFLVSRLLANLGVAASTPLLDRFHRPADRREQRWLNGFYVDSPEEWDDPYRFFRW